MARPLLRHSPGKRLETVIRICPGVGDDDVAVAAYKGARTGDEETPPGFDVTSSHFKLAEIQLRHAPRFQFVVILIHAVRPFAFSVSYRGEGIALACIQTGARVPIILSLRSLNRIECVIHANRLRIRVNNSSFHMFLDFSIRTLDSLSIYKALPGL